LKTTLREKFKKTLKSAGIFELVMFFKNALQLALGIVVFTFTRKTPHASYQSMISLFCQTRGLSNDIISWCLARLHHPYKIQTLKGVLGELSEIKLNHIIKDIDEKGYYVFEKKLSPADCKKLYEFALKTPMRVTSATDPAIKNGDIVPCYNPSKPQGIRYDCDPDDLIKYPVVQKIISDASIIAVAQKYLKAKPILDIITMWWSTKSKKADAEAAQLFHFDMDRIKWLKFFIYIKDVNPENGPHSFIEGSHKSQIIPASLLKQGYARITDEEVAKHFSQNKFIEFSGPMGTIIAEDTRGLHKGKTVEQGDRLVFQLEYTNSLLGTIYKKIKLPCQIIPELKLATEQYPRTFSMLESLPAHIADTSNNNSYE
jgi:hypothetical protein